MGASGSNHIQVFGNCYDLDRPYAESFQSGIYGCVFLFSAIIFLISNFVTSFKNKILIGFMIFTFLCSLYSYFLHEPLSKWSFARKYGKKVPCTKPDPNCDENAKLYSSGKIQGPYNCDERFKYR